MEWHNWSRTVAASPVVIARPSDEDDVIALVRAAYRDRKTLKVVGAGHSCSQVAVGAQTLVSLDAMTGMVAFDRAKRTATFAAGTSLRQINEELAGLGMALPNLPAIDAPTIAGAIATGTHGSGLAHGSLADSVTGLRIVTSPGIAIDVHDSEQLDAMRVHLGCFGIVTRVKLAVVDAFDLACHEQRLPLDDVLANLDERNEQMFGLWWFPHVDDAIARTLTQVRRNDRPRPRVSAWVSTVLVANRLHEALLYASARGFGNGATVNARHLRTAFGPRGHSRTGEGTSAEMLTSTILIRQRVLEYGIPYVQAVDTLRALQRLIIERQLVLHAPIDVRFSRAESAWLGLAHGRATCYIGIVGYLPFGREIGYEPAFRAIDELLRAAGGRPHWGKVHYQDATSLRGVYPRFDDFTKLRENLDPTGLFVNPYLERVLGAKR
jgi:L-gulonolactone oxidase